MKVSMLKQIIKESVKEAFKEVLIEQQNQTASILDTNVKNSKVVKENVRPKVDSNLAAALEEVRGRISPQESKLLAPDFSSLEQPNTGIVSEGSSTITSSGNAPDFLVKAKAIMNAMDKKKE